MNIKNRFSKLLPIFAAAVLCITTVTAAAEDKTDIKTASINNYNIEVLEEESEDTPDIPEPTEAPTEAPKPTEPTKPHG